MMMRTDLAPFSRMGKEVRAEHLPTILDCFASWDPRVRREDVKAAIAGSRGGQGSAPTTRLIMGLVADDYIANLPTGTPKLSRRTFFQYVTGKRARLWILDELEAAGIRKKSYAKIDRSRLRHKAEATIREIKAEGRAITVAQVIRRTHALYCEGLPRSEHPDFRSFRDLFHGRRGTKSHSKFDLGLFAILGRHGLHKQKHVRIEPQSGTEALTAARRELEEKGATSDYAVARRAHEIYSEGRPDSDRPTVQAFRRLLERMR